MCVQIQHVLARAAKSPELSTLMCLYLLIRLKMKELFVGLLRV